MDSPRGLGAVVSSFNEGGVGLTVSVYSGGAAGGWVRVCLYGHVRWVCLT